MVKAYGSWLKVWTWQKVRGKGQKVTGYRLILLSVGLVEAEVGVGKRVKATGFKVKGLYLWGLALGKKVKASASYRVFVLPPDSQHSQADLESHFCLQILLVMTLLVRPSLVNAFFRSPSGF
jgi:hypothetical protein